MTTLNVRTKSNENLRISIEVNDNAGDPVDLSEATAITTIRLNFDELDAVTPIFQATSGEDDEIVITDNFIIIDIPFDIVLAWVFDVAYYDVVIQYSEASQDSIIDGKVLKTWGITR